MSLSDYLNIKISCDDELKEILIAELAMIGYESMLEADDGLEAYIKPDQFSEGGLRQVLAKYHLEDFKKEEVKERNWNEEWEKNYDPIEIEDQVYIRATFHPAGNFPYEIVINPRMSFGTGHHATTHLMVQHQLHIDHVHKRVLDAGCGTAILAIMAEKLGAAEIIAYDNNAWSTDNAPENVELNKCNNIVVKEGTINTLGLSGKFDIILANINKNVLLDEMAEFVKYMKPEGVVVFSGFYINDVDDMVDAAQSNQLSLVAQRERNKWAALIFKKEA